MSYDKVILELLSRIKNLEEDYEHLNSRIEQLENGFTQNNSNIGGKRSIVKLTDEMIDECYIKGKECYENGTADYLKISQEISEKTGMNSRSAYMYLMAVKSMIAGEPFKRAISNRATEKYFEYIRRDYGITGLKKALDCVKKHVEYRKSCGLIADGLENLCSKVEATL